MAEKFTPGCVAIERSPPRGTEARVEMFVSVEERSTLSVRPGEKLHRTAGVPWGSPTWSALPAPRVNAAD